MNTFFCHRRGWSLYGIGPRDTWDDGARRESALAALALLLMISDEWGGVLLETGRSRHVRSNLTASAAIAHHR